MMSSFSGKIKEFPQLSVDRFDGRNLASTAYFLSHAHTDHMNGLGSPQFLDHLESNSGVYLYCSQVTARFLQTSIRYRPLSPFIFPLPHEDPVKIAVPNVAEEATHQLWVTLIPAAHCPGSVMFLFEGRGGTVLYTGDFRINAGEVARLRTLHNSDGTVKTIDSLHIDTTFCHRDIMQFPGREESSQAVGEAVEDWLARGNNFLIHLVCPSIYGYEYVYRSLHDQFGMKIHVSRWKYQMYDTLPEIQEALTIDATMTWIHACCDYKMKNREEITEGSLNRQLPCRCVPFGVNSAPNIRVIKPSALFYTIYQSAKEIKQTTVDGTFCRVLFSMHASCSEVLDMVSYLRPRKVFPNVIPLNSTKEEVLKLLHEALNRSGDHYSIEYGGSQRTTLGSYKRQLQSSDSNCNGSGSGSSMLDAGLLEVYLSSPNKRRRHSDSNMKLILPTPRGNMKGSLSLEGEGRHESKAEEDQPSTSVPKDSLENSGGDLEWKDPFSPSPTKSQHPFFDSAETCVGAKEATNEAITTENGSKRNLLVELDCSVGESNVGTRTNSVNGKSDSCSGKETVGTCSSRKSTIASDMDDDALSRLGGSQDSVELCSVFSEDGDKDSIFSTMEGSRPTSVIGIADESPIKQSRKMWYKHKYFSTPVHDEVDKNLKQEVGKPCMGPRSSSLPLPESCRDAMLSPDLFASTDGDRNLPLITVSSPSDQASESQVSDDTNVTVVLSSGDPSDSDALFVDELPPDADTATSSVRPSVIRSPPKSDIGLTPNSEERNIESEEKHEKCDSERARSVKWERNLESEEKHEKCESERARSVKWFEPSDSGWIHTLKKKGKRHTIKEDYAKMDVDNEQNERKINNSEDRSFVKNKNEINIAPENQTNISHTEFIDLVSDNDCSPEFTDIIFPKSQNRRSDSLPSSTRSSCLKTVRRTDDHVEVVSLEHQPL